MNLCSQLLLSLAACLLCISSSAEYSLKKREHLPEEEVRCLRLISQDQCISGFTQELVDLAVQCGDRIYRNYEEDCAANPMGEICFGPLNDAIIPDEEITRACGSSPTNCSSECKDLLTTTRDRLGCCVNTYNDTELSSRADSLQFSFSLWTLCGVDLVAELCESTINLTRTQLDPTCTEETFENQQYFNVFCRSQFIESTINAVGDACDTLQLQLADTTRCSADEDGQYCSAIPQSRTELFSQPASRACTNTSMCDSLCMEALNNGINSLGCCFISLFNDTVFNDAETPPDWLTFEFWQQCNLTSPGFCEPRINEAESNGGFDGFATPSSALVLRAPTCLILIIALTIFK